MNPERDVRHDLNYGNDKPTGNPTTGTSKFLK